MGIMSVYPPIGPRVVPTEEKPVMVEEKPVMGKVVEKEKIVPTEEEPVMGTLPDNNDPPASFGTVVDPPNEKDNITIAYNNSTVKRTSVCVRIVMFPVWTAIYLAGIVLITLFSLSPIGLMYMNLKNTKDGGGKIMGGEKGDMYLIVKNMKSGQIEFIDFDEIPDE